MPVRSPEPLLVATRGFPACLDPPIHGPHTGHKSTESAGYSSLIQPRRIRGTVAAHFRFRRFGVSFPALTPLTVFFPNQLPDLKFPPPPIFGE